MRSPEFEAMIGPARLYPELWRLLLGLLIIVFAYLGTLAIEAVLLFAAVGPLEYVDWLRRISSPTEAVPTLFLLATFAGLLIGPVLAAAACHYRGPGSLFGPWDELRRGVFTALAVTVPLYALLLALAMSFVKPVENLGWDAWLGYLPIALPLILVQITAEELVFRGYLQQQLAARFRARAIWMVVPSLLFASLHWNPMAGNVVWLILLTTFVFALVAADLTERTGSLGAAIGLHLVNNVYGLTIMSVSGTITGLSKWTTPFGLGESGPLVLSLAANIAFLAVVWRLLRWALDR